MREGIRSVRGFEEQHAVGEIAASLLPDLEELRDEGEGGAETGEGAEEFDGKRGEQLVEVSWFYSSRRWRDSTRRRPGCCGWRWKSQQKNQTKAPGDIQAPGASARTISFFEGSLHLCEGADA
jgi:hypothetical protein